MRLSPRRLARLGAALREPAVRDAMWLGIDDRSLAADELLGQLHSRLPPPYLAAPLFLYGWQQWRSGSGMLAATAAERALRADPGLLGGPVAAGGGAGRHGSARTPPLAGGPAHRQPA